MRASLCRGSCRGATSSPAAWKGTSDTSGRSTARGTCSGRAGPPALGGGAGFSSRCDDFGLFAVVFPQGSTTYNCLLLSFLQGSTISVYLPLAFPQGSDCSRSVCCVDLGSKKELIGPEVLFLRHTHLMTGRTGCRAPPPCCLKSVRGNVCPVSGSSRESTQLVRHPLWWHPSFFCCAPSFFL